MTATAGLATLGATVVLICAWEGADAAEGLYLTWNECAAGGAAMRTASFPCDSNSGERSLYAAFTLPHAVDSVVAVVAVVDLQGQGAELPPWWRLEPKGCRYPSLVATATFAAGGACEDFWGGEATLGGPPSYAVGEPRGAASQARIQAAFALLPERHRRLEAGPMYYALRLVLRNAGTTTCGGCAEGACLVLNSILIGRLEGGDLLLETPGPGQANRATWQGSGVGCDPVPVQARTWGALKSLYRGVGR